MSIAFSSLHKLYVTLVITIRFVNDVNLDDYLLYYSGAKKIIIEEGIQAIGNYTFANNVVESIELPDSILSIGDYAFYNCRNIKEFTVPKNVLTIGKYAFYNASNMEKISLPDSLLSIGECSLLKLNKDRYPVVTVYVYYNKGIVCDNLFEEQHMSYVSVGDGVYSIGNSVFANCSNLISVSVGDGVSSFGTNCFLNDNDIILKIRKVDGYIDDNIYNDKLLHVTKVIIEDGITGIGKYAFYNDVSVVVCIVPDSVSFIGEYAFYNCNSLEEINIPYGVENILSHTFFGCSSLKSITIPNTIMSIEDYAFYGCVSATKLIISNKCESIGNNAFYNCKSIKELIIPESVKFIGEYAFRSCVEIKELRFGDNVEEIGACAFYDCNSLQKVYLGKKIISLDDRLFYGCVNLTDLYVYAPLSFIHDLAFYGAEDCVIHMGQDTYMIDRFTELGMSYEIDSNITYEYKVVFVDYDGTITSSKTYKSGDVVDVPTEPIRESDNTYTYGFIGWDKEVTICGGNVVYTAVYSRTYIEYTVTFRNDDGTVVATRTYHYGETIESPLAPTKASDNTYDYTFSGWDSALGTCTGDASFTATHDKKYIEYTVTFMDADGTVISQKTYHYGDTVELPDSPSRAADSTYTYSFTGWDSDVTAVDGDRTYTAVYARTFIEYTVTFVDADGKVISERTYHYGDSIQAPEDPFKDSDETYDYTFSGWDAEVGACTGDMTFRATYDRTYSKSYLSGVLRDELLNEIDSIKDVNLSTFSVIAKIESKLSDLIDTDRTIVQDRLNSLIEEYNEFVSLINSEFNESLSVTKKWIFGDAVSIGLIATMALVFCKRRFLL